MESRRAAQWSIGSPWIRAVVIMVVVSLIGWMLGPWATRAMAPPLAKFFSGFRARIWHQPASQLEAERDRFRQQLQAVTEQLLAAERKLKTAASLDRLETFVKDRQFDAMYGQVVAYSPDPGIQTVTINRGKRDGVQTGLAAVSGEGFVVGIVRRVTHTTATILLITDPQTRLVAKIRNEAESRGLVQGEQGLSIRMNFIPKHERVDSGQLVVTSGADASIPVDLPIGTVGTINPQQGDLFQSMTVVSPVEIQNLDVVAIILLNL